MRRRPGGGSAGGRGPGGPGGGRGPGSGGRGPDPSRSSALTSPSDRAKAAFVLLVGFSGGMMALQGGASPALVGLMTLGGIAAGGALLWYVLWIFE